VPAPRKILATTALAAACAALGPAAAGAATLKGTVVGRPTVTAKSVVVPVLLSSAGERTAGTALARVVVPAARGLKSSYGRLKAADLRIGDRVTASVSRVSARPHAKALRVGRRGATPSFAKLDQQRVSVTAEITRAIASTKQLIADPTSVLDPKTPAADNNALREQLRAVRTDLNLLIANMRTTADALDATVAQIVAARPVDPARRAVAESRQKAIVDGLTSDALHGRDAAAALELAVVRLDEAMNAVGDPSAAPLPIDGLGAVSDLLYAVLDLLRGPGS
jgi:hypothetical protein